MSVGCDSRSERFVVLADGAALWTAVTGSGAPVVRCHGGPGLWDYLEPLASLIEDEFTVVRYDQRGCGRSSGAGPFTTAQAVDDWTNCVPPWTSTAGGSSATPGAPSSR